MPWMGWYLTDVSYRFGSSGSRLTNSTLFHCLLDVITDPWPKHCLQHALFHSLVIFMYLFQGFPSKCGRHKKSGTLGCNPIFNGEIFPEVPVCVELLWKLPLITRPSIWNAMYQKLKYRIIPCLLMICSKSLELYGIFPVTWLTAIMGSCIPSSSMGRGWPYLEHLPVDFPLLSCIWHQKAGMESFSLLTSESLGDISTICFL